ncbi:RNA-directed DNA polymerase from mobile element jockey [Paramuricea clavata]|uniref:RNA-directed DNA polymerase from mobile element jockey n=1 Tax=Paramuricea clavata TaxID=317549 RepID=A0A6S7HS21_PARCT|nr:RNA-directed DNA polymerase from mobile element jockey [Paramuricea clavata]
MKTMKDYHDLYLETDVLLLDDVFENFRRTCLESYELDPAHYVSAPGLSWDAFLKKSGEEIELRIGEEQDCWDNSDYPKDSPYYSTHNKKVIGKFKDEAEGVPIIEFVGLRSKMYSYVKENGGGGMTAKGGEALKITVEEKPEPEELIRIGRLPGESSQEEADYMIFERVREKCSMLHPLRRTITNILWIKNNEDILPKETKVYLKTPVSRRRKYGR